MENRVRVRFAPSPTGGLHLGGMRTVLYNYLFAKKHGGDFIVRIEDTDQGRFVEGAEQYIFDCLEWCGLLPDESPIHGGDMGPYRQSERKPIYLQYAEQLITNGYAYYAFDSKEELDQMRIDHKTEENPSPQYDGRLRMNMRNSLSLPGEEVKKLLESGSPYVVRIKMPAGETITFKDMIHHEVSFESSLVDDKVLLKADGMPTYHLAVVVDDYLMKITHAFRGEEWLSSAPVHVLLWKYLFGLDNMPQWAHLPLILGPNGKLSKRDGAKYGFPVFAKNWTDPKTNELTEGFMEKGFLPEAFINLLAVLGWNDGTEQEVFSKNELVEKFTVERVHKAGAKFDFEKAKWFNHEWIKKLSANDLRQNVKKSLLAEGFVANEDIFLDKVIELVKDRCVLLPDFIQQAGYFFKNPQSLDTLAVMPKWDVLKRSYFESLILKLPAENIFNVNEIEHTFRSLANEMNIKLGELQMIFRVMLVGNKIGPAVFAIAETIGREDTLNRIRHGIIVFG
ncbi:MAG: glutamate--tRNA ligase [Ferruginibacter sp.]